MRRISFAARTLSTAARALSTAASPAASPSVARLEGLFAAWGANDYIGEPLSITAHNEQAAAAARAAGEADEVVVAALLHDVGHLLELEAGFAPGMDGCGNLDHEESGAEFLRSLGLPDDVRTGPVRARRAPLEEADPPPLPLPPFSPRRSRSTCATTSTRSATCARSTPTTTPNSPRRRGRPCTSRAGR